MKIGFFHSSLWLYIRKAQHKLAKQSQERNSNCSLWNTQCLCTYIVCIYLYMYRSTYTEEWGRWNRRACLELGWLWNVLKFDTESKSRDLMCSFSPASCNDLWSNLPQARPPLITSHCSTWSNLVLKAPLQFCQKDMHKVIYSTYFPQLSNDHRAVNLHNPLKADLNFSLSLRLRCTQTKSLPTPCLCFAQSID